jgi:hypothetical protein
MATKARPQTQQLRLLDSSSVPLKLRLDERTRRLGLAHIAKLRAQLAEQQRHRISAERSAAA